MTMTIDGLTPTEQRIMDRLSDGRVHSAEELHGCLCDELGGMNNLWIHIKQLKDKIENAGYVIANRRGKGYQLARPVGSANDGRK